LDRSNECDGNYSENTAQHNEVREFSLITIYGSLSSGRSTLYIIRSLVALWIWLTPSFIVMHYSSKRLSMLIDKIIADDVAIILGLIVLLLTYVAVYYLSFLSGPVLLVSQDKSLFESMKPLVAGVVSMILLDIAHIIYVLWRK